MDYSIYSTVSEIVEYTIHKVNQVIISKEEEMIVRHTKNETMTKVSEKDSSTKNKQIDFACIA